METTNKKARTPSQKYKQKNTEKTFSIFVNLIRNSNDDYIVNIFDDKNIP